MTRPNTPPEPATCAECGRPVLRVHESEPEAWIHVDPGADHGVEAVTRPVAEQ